MAISRDATRSGSSTRASRAALEVDLSAGDGDWPQEPERARDWKRMALVLGLGTLSWVATYIGMLELIESNMGDLPLVHKAVIGFSVAMLMTMIVWLLDQMFAPIPTFTKLSYVGGYVFLTLISVGFGFGFYWKVLESRSESSRSAESAVTQVQSSLHAAATRMTQLSVTLEQLNQVSTEKAEIERTRGASCPNSRPGDGPRRKLRDDDAQRFAFAAEFVKTRVGAVNADLGALDGDLVKVAGADKSTIDDATGTRNEFMKSLSRKLDMTVTGFNAFRTDPQLKQIRADLAERADKTVFPDTKGGTFSCPDPQLQQALKGVVRAIDQLPDLEKPKIAAVEGSEATIEAFRRLTATFYGALAFKLPPSADELRELQKKAVQSVEASPAIAKSLSGDPVVGLSKRDYIPLAIAVFVDLCLLLVSMSRPMNRLHGLVPKMRAAERGPVIQILSRFNEIHRDDEIRRNFEVFRHVVFDFHGAYYVAVPLDAPYRPTGAYTKGYSTEDIEDLGHEAHLLANLFTSFEQEKIFSRVYSPLLTTRAVKKKLLRQGSKFAHADAFRIYRFRDGAWSEIILGAVMGAARRVEAEKMKRRLAQELFSGHEPTLPSGEKPKAESAPTLAVPADSVVPRAAEASTVADAADADAVAENVAGLAAAGGGMRGSFLARRAAQRAAQSTSGAAAGVAAAGAGGHVGTNASAAAHGMERRTTAGSTDSSTIAEFGPYAARASREIAEERYRASLPTLRGEDGALERPRRRNRDERNAAGDAQDGSDAIPAGEVVLFAIPGTAAQADATAQRDDDAARDAAPRTAYAGTPASPVEIQDTGFASTVASTSPIASTTVRTSAVEQPATDAPTPTSSAEPRIGVVLRRETTELSLPVSEAMLPRDLIARGLAMVAQATDPKSTLGTDAATQSRRLGPPMTGTSSGQQQLAQGAAIIAESDPGLAQVARGDVVAADVVEVDVVDADDEEPAPLFAEPDIDIRYDEISRRFRPPAAE